MSWDERNSVADRVETLFAIQEMGESLTLQEFDELQGLLELIEDGCW